MNLRNTLEINNKACFFMFIFIKREVNEKELNKKLHLWFNKKSLKQLVIN